ncbi:hypothetical protein FACS1894189_1650 [Planctomycetales bacterium]|nr:hypothetical protein FACS1894189_1650 [Planctomycetales bacterium]
MLDTVPSEFSRTVPGLVDLAQPAFDDVAPRKLFKDPKRDAFWYRREFNLDKIPTVARLKIHKAMFGCKVIVNGQEVGEHFGSVTPAYFEVTDKLKKRKNEIIVRVGADLQAAAGKAVWMSDYEKIHYIPGIFDSVELICSGTPYIENIQTAPDIQNGKVRIQIRLVNSGAAVRTSLKLTIKEWKSGKSVGNVSVPVKIPQKGETTIDSTVAIENCQLWSPESPFLYVAEINTGADFATTRFGMRTFRFNTETKQAELNGKPYIMRGTNFTAYRFFEDPLRGTLPWDEKWIRTLHERLKGMHWNCVWYCIGFPPVKHIHTKSRASGEIVQPIIPPLARLDRRRGYSPLAPGKA